jgi:Transposase
MLKYIGSRRNQTHSSGNIWNGSGNTRRSHLVLLKESFGQLWSYEREGWARRFFENWRASLKWQRLKLSEKFAEMIDRHWDGIAAYCRPENKVSLGFIEGLNNKIRAPRLRLTQRRISAAQGSHLHAASVVAASPGLFCQLV